jgi:hypothetical protein
MIAPVVNYPGGTAISTKAVTIIASNSYSVSAIGKCFLQAVTHTKSFGLHRAGTGVIANIVASKTFIKIRAANRAFIYKSLIKSRVVACAVVYIAYPNIAGAISSGTATCNTYRCYAKRNPVLSTVLIILQYKVIVSVKCYNL